MSVTAGAASGFTTLRVTAPVAVTLSARSVEGILVSFSPAVIPAGSETSTVSIAAGGTVAAGSYSVTIFATRAAGVTDTVTLTLTVAAQPLTGTAVTLRYCAEDAPIWLAVRENNGFWTRVTPNSGTNTHQFRVSETLNSVGIASVDTVGTGHQLRVIYARHFEMAGINGALNLGECGGSVANGTVVNAGTPVSATVALANSWVNVDERSTGQFTLSGVAAAPQELIASRRDPLTAVPNRLILRRGQNLGGVGTIPSLDFDAAEAFAPAQGSVTLSGLGSDTAVVTTAFRGVGGRANGQLGRPAAYPGNVGTVAFTAIPVSQLESTELQQLTVTASSANSTTSSRSTTVFFREAGPVTVAMGSAITPPIVTRLSGPYGRARVLFGVESPYGRFVTATFAQQSASRVTSILVTPGIALAPWDFSIPDLSDVPGWNSDWGLRTGLPIAWSVTAAGGQNFRLGTTVSDGAVLRTATQSGVLPSP